MRRIQFIELHEQPWLPSLLRDEITDALQFGLNFTKCYAPIARLLQRALHATGSSSIIDLCSGGGGPWADLGRRLRGKKGPLFIWLTDKYPNRGAAESVDPHSGNEIRVYPEAVDAMQVPDDLQGLRTIFTSFHHFSPREARAILRNAVEAKEGICVFEITRRTVRTICFMPFWALFLSIASPWIRPFRSSRLLWTYLIPVIPFVLLFDGIVSCLRSYRPKEMHEIVESLNKTAYQWEIGELSGRLPITYLIGIPRAASA